MGLINSKLDNLKESDLWSFMLFALFKARDLPEYSSLSELAYVLDKTSLLNLCEYFGGQTIRIPTCDELELMIYALTLYWQIDINNLSYEQAIKLITCDTLDTRKLKSSYIKIRELLNTYQISSRGLE